MVADGKGIPPGSAVTSASPAELKPAAQIAKQNKVTANGPGRPQKSDKRLIGYKAMTVLSFAKNLNKHEKTLSLHI